MVTSVPPMHVSPGVDWGHATQSATPNGSDSAKTSPNQKDTDRQAFAELMRVPSSAVARLDPGPTVSAPSMIEKFAATQNADMRELLQSTRDLMKAAPNMSMGEVMAFGNEATMNLAITTTQYNAAGNLAKSAGKGVETLMRNQ